MSRFTFKYESDWDNTEVKMVCDADSLDEACGAFENFLKGAGFVFEGVLDFVIPDSDDQEIDFQFEGEDEADDNK